jgi:DNA-nicking Smr family endonuclease
VEARIDLHGHTQDSAREELIDFILAARADGVRRLLVITGKGRDGRGVLRARFLDWIAEPDVRPYIAGYAPAHVRHGGGGAFYLLLKAR